MGWKDRLARFWHSYTGRMVIGVITIHLVLVPSLFYGMLIIFEENIKSQFVDQVRYNTFLYSSLIKKNLLEDDVEAQNQVLDEILIRGDISYVELVRSDSSSVIPDTSLHLTEEDYKEDFSFGANGDDIYFISLEMIDQTSGSYLGKLKLGYDELSTKNQIVTAYRYGILFAVLYLALSVILVIFFGQKLVSPLKELRGLSRSIASGDEDISMDISTNIAEIKYLARDLDTMRNILLSRTRDIETREKRFHAVLDGAGEGIISIDRNGIILLFNKAAEKMFEYQSEDVIGKNVAMLMPNPERDEHDDYISNYIKTRKGKIIGTGRKVNAMDSNGNLIPIYLDITEVSLNDEIVFIGILHDLRKQVELESRLLQFLKAIQQSPFSIMITDTEGKIEYVNPFFCKVTGYQEFEIIGKKPSILRSSDTSDSTYQELWGTIKKGRIWRGILKNKKKDGTMFWESATIGPVLDDNNKVVKFIAVKEDITEKRMKELMLQQAIKLETVGKMTNSIAHDFNNLLTIIQGNLQFLQDSIDDNTREDNISLIEDALSAAKDGSSLIKQILAFSRKEESKTEPIEINMFMNKLERLLSRVIPASINMKTYLSKEDILVKMDPYQLESALLNIIVNARDAMPDGGKLSVTSKPVTFETTYKVEKGSLNPGKYLNITVEDTGIGISESIKSKIIEPFFTTKSSTTGSGLGLSMVYDFVTKAGGGLEIFSKVNEGTTMSLYLPVYEDIETYVNVDEEKIEQVAGGNETILVVEDRDRVRKFACRVLKRLGYKLFEAADAKDAINKLESNDQIDLVFTDIVMPGNMNGRQLANQVYAKNKSMKILLTTGLEIEKKHNEIIGIDFPVLKKPYTVYELSAAVRKILDQQKLT